MSEPAQSPRMPIVEIASDDDLPKGLAYTLGTLGYSFNTEYPPQRKLIDFEAWKPEDPEKTRLVITITAGTADEGTIARGLAGLGWYREHRRTSDVHAWIIATDFTAGARYAAQACPDLTLKSYGVELSLGDALILRAS